MRLETLPASAIRVDNYRQDFDPDGLQALAADIAANGLAMPPTVEPIGTAWLLIDGERRLRAMRDVLGWEAIPCTVREATDAASRKLLQLGANVNAAATAPHEDGDAIAAIMAEGLTLEDVAARLGKGRRWIEDRLACARTSAATRDALRTGLIGVRLGATLSRLDENRQRVALRAVVDGNLTPTELAARIEKLSADQSAEENEQGGFALLVEEWTEAKREQTEREAAAAVSMPLGRAEIGELLGVRTATVSQWAARDLLPAPDGRISGSPVWHRETVETWAKATGRMG